MQIPQVRHHCPSNEKLIGVRNSKSKEDQEGKKDTEFESKDTSTHWEARLRRRRR